MEALVPVGDGLGHIIAASAYGYSGASSANADYVMNETLAANLVVRLNHNPKIPYAVGTDINIDPLASEVLALDVTNGVVHDLPYDCFAGGVPTATSLKDHVHEDMEGGKHTDTILTNYTASHRCPWFWYDWAQSEGYDHVALSMDIDQQRFHEEITVAVPPCRLKLPAKAFGKARSALQTRLQAKFNGLWANRVAQAFDTAEANDDLEEMHTLWNWA